VAHWTSLLKQVSNQVEQCVRAALMARYHTKIAKITIDVDVRFAKQAGRVLTEAQGPLPTAMS
jgi:hypothetical protein